MKNVTKLILGIFLVGAFSCANDDNTEPEGLFPAYDSGGATARFDLEARPLPKIPFPSDLATRLDPNSPTGKRVNVSTMSPTELETKVREKVNQMEGFSILPQITIEFDKPLDARNIVKRHQEDVPDFKDDAIFLVNVDPDSEGYGTLVMLDLGRGNYPVTMSRPDKYFDFDSRREGTNLVFESVQEKDENGNGVLDPLEDTDDDEVWDQPNTVNPGADPLEPGEMMEFYERETNTLVMRPVTLLRERTTYAVVLSSKLIDEEGFAVNSPFKYINHTRQNEDLEPLRKILPAKLPSRFDASLKDVRLAWTFTTQSTTQPMYDIRAGMYGEGKLGWLAEQYPAELNFVSKAASDDSDDNPMVIRLGALLGLIVDALAGGLEPLDREALLIAFNDVDYLVAGSYTTPFFLVDKDGLEGTEEEIALNQNVFDENETFEIDFDRGEAKVGKDEVTFLCAVPKEKEGRKAPFPVVFYGHGYGSSRIEGIGFAGQMAKFGLATCAIDNATHGLVVPPEFADLDLVKQALIGAKMENLVEVLNHGRHRDLTNDGVPDSGADYWVSDLFHLRDNVRQTTVDYMQFIRVLRSFDGTQQWPDKPDEDNVFVRVRPNIIGGFDADGDGKGELKGDFNGDGVVDFGGEQPVYAWGQSLGGIQSAALVGIDPVVKAAAPTAGAAGLLDVGIRSAQGGVPQAVFLPFLGPFVLGRPVQDFNVETGEWEDVGRYQLEFLVNTAFDESYVPFATVEGWEHGDKMVVRNLNREIRPEIVEEGRLTSNATVRNTGFRTGMASDAWGANQRRKALGFDPSQNVAALDGRNRPQEDGLTQTIFHTQSRRVVREQSIATGINFDWSDSSVPIAGLNPADHSMDFTGIIEGPGEVTLKLETTGRARIWIDGEQVIDVRNNTSEVDFEFEPGTAHAIRIQYDRNRAAGKLIFSWIDGTNEQVVPTSALKSHVPLTEAEQAELEKHIAADEHPRQWGDPYVIEIYSADGELKDTIDTFRMSTYFQNIKYSEGLPLAALAEGWGQRRQTPGFRQFLSIAQFIIDAGDPIAFSRHIFSEPLEFPYETDMFKNGGSNILVVPTIGDANVPINTGIAIARFAGIIDTTKNDERYGMTMNQFLIQNYVYEGISWLDRFSAHPNALFDPDDLDEGQYRLLGDEGDSDPNPDADRPLRATVQTDFGVSGMRIPYMRTTGEHGFFLPGPTKAFDIDSYMANLIGYYFATGGKELVDDLCLEELPMKNCSFFNPDDWERPTPYQ